MKRDLELTRRILLSAEEAEDGTLTTEDLADETHSETVVAQHLLLLEEAGLLEVNLLQCLDYGPPTEGTVERLTWSGHEFLDTIRSESIWSRTKEVIQKNSLGTSVEIIKLVATAAVKARLGLPD